MSHADLHPSVLWRNRQTKAHLVLRPKPRNRRSYFEAQISKPEQTEAHLVLRSKPRNRRSDFEAQITKPELSVLRPKPRNPPPPWFWGSTKKPVVGFEAKLGETVATSFEVKLEKTVAAGFEAKSPETVATGFKAKPVKTVRVVLRPNYSQIVAIGFEAQTDEKPSQWFWDQTTDKPSTLVLRLNQETRAPCLHVHGADCKRRHPTSRSPGHRVPDLSDHLRSSAPCLLLLPRFSSLHDMPHLPAAHHETSKYDSPNETKVKEKQNELSRIQIQTSQSQWLITIKPMNIPHGFSSIWCSLFFRSFCLLAVLFPQPDTIAAFAHYIGACHAASSS
jgi:hypothetical protein